MTEIYALEKSPSPKLHVAAIAGLAVACLAAMVAVQEFIVNGGLFATLFILPLGVGACGLICWHYVVTSPFRHIETRFNAVQVQACLALMEGRDMTFAQAAGWLGLGEKCPMTPEAAEDALVTFLRAREQAKANGLAKRIGEAQEGRDVRAVI